MASGSDTFTLGSIIWCRTCFDGEIEGEVLAFEPQNKMLILKCNAANGDSKKSDIKFVNLSYISELQVKKEASSHSEPPQSLNLQRLNTRLRNQIEEKRRKLAAIKANVSKEGQSLFIALSKVLLSEVKWQNSDIVIWNQESQVVITPPYQKEHVRGNANTNEYKYILKLVEKHLQELALNPQNSGPTQNSRSSQ